MGGKKQLDSCRDWLTESQAHMPVKSYRVPCRFATPRLDVVWKWTGLLWLGVGDQTWVGTACARPEDRRIWHAAPTDRGGSSWDMTRGLTQREAWQTGDGAQITWNPGYKE